MKKLFTLVALLAVFMGAKAEWVQDSKIDYSQNTGFPFFVMGYVPEWVDGVMTDYGALYKYVEVKDDATETSDVIVKNQGGTEYYKIGPLAEPAWHQYFLADGIPTELDGAYTVKAMVKASEAVTINVNMGWGWNDGQSKGAQVSIGTDWAEVEWEYTGIGGTSCNLVAQPGSCTATIEWKYVIVGHNAKQAAPTVWQEWLTSDGKSVVVEKEVKDIANWRGGAEFGNWPDWALETDPEAGCNINWRGDRTGEICAWSIVRGKNIDSDQTIDPITTPEGFETVTAKPRPFPCEIMADPDKAGNHLFVVKTTAADNPITDWQAWDNQFFIMSPKAWKQGEIVKISFKYKAEKAAKADTQIHNQHPSHYKHWQAIGTVEFGTDWKEYSKELTFSQDQADGWCVAFNLNTDNKEENTFYFDDLSWQSMVLDEGWFVASSNASTGIEYDYENAVECVYDADEDAYVGTVGEVGKKDTWVNEVMISSIRGNDAAFKGATIKLTETLKEEEWLGYTTATVSKIKLPAAGVWQISVAPGDNQIQFVKLEGEAAKEPVDIVTNETEMVVNATERDWKPAKDDETPQDGEDGVGTGQPWDNQFWIAANRDLTKDEVTVLKFKYKAKNAARTSTQAHKVGGDGMPCTYLNWQAIGDVNFTEEWQDFSTDFTVPAGDDGMRSFTFNLSEVKAANDYYFKDVQWYLKNDTEGKTLENLIDATGTKNFFVKIGAGTDPYQYGTNPSGIENVNAKKAKASTAIYNLAGQRVDNGFKGIVIKDGKKFVK